MNTAGRQSGDDAAEPSRVAVQALIYSETLAPDVISARLGLLPSTTAKKGIEYGKRTGTRVHVPRHMWKLSSESHVAALEVSDHLDWILSKLFPLREQLQELCESGEAQCALVGVVWTSGTSAHFQITTRQMEKLLALKLQLQLEFADYGDVD